MRMNLYGTIMKSIGRVVDAKEPSFLKALAT